MKIKFKISSLLKLITNGTSDPVDQKVRGVLIAKLSTSIGFVRLSVIIKCKIVN